MSLSPAQIRQFHDDGYLVLPQVVPQHLVLRALRQINHHLGEAGIPPEKLPVFRSQSYCPGLNQHPALVDLYRLSAVPGIMETLLGAGNLAPCNWAQIALRFPSPVDTDAKLPVGHLDGISTPTNGMAAGTYTRGFAALAVILLSEVPAPASGNFTVWPGSHRAYEAHFKAHGLAELLVGTPTIPLPHPAHQITGRAGDVIITHHQMFHAAAPNASPHIRYATIYRLSHKDTPTFTTGANTDIWHEWDGVRAVMAKG